MIIRDAITQLTASEVVEASTESSSLPKQC
jgi:hypothetical protein